jgi:hypothetical protein
MQRRYKFSLLVATIRRIWWRRILWFLIAGEQITRAKNHVNKTMTMKELLKAEHGA